MGVPKNFHGKPGRSGRKSAYNEYNKINAINKLWEKINNKVMAGEELTEYEEKLVLALLPKTIKTETDITSNGKSLVVNLDKDIADKYASHALPEDNSEGQPQV
jgi:hypothetical protein